MIHATGAAGLAICRPGSGRTGRRGKGQAVALRFDAEGLPQVYAGGLHVVPHADGTVAIGSTSETHGRRMAPTRRPKRWSRGPWR